MKLDAATQSVVVRLWEFPGMHPLLATPAAQSVDFYVELLSLRLGVCFALQAFRVRFTLKFTVGFLMAFTRNTQAPDVDVNILTSGLACQRLVTAVQYSSNFNLGVRKEGGCSP